MKVLIVGGVAGGAAFAARLRRLNENAEIIIFERGAYVSFANCGLPYYAGEVIKERSELIISSPEFFEKRFNVDVRINNEVLSIDRKSRKITVRDIGSGKEYSEDYDKLILSPGAEPFVPPLEGADLDCVHTVRTIPDIDSIKERLDDGSVKKAVVIGAGFIGIEMAENLAERGVKTSIIEKMDQVMPPFDKDMAVILARQIAFHDVDLYLEEEVVKITGLSGGCIVETKSGRKIPADMVIMSIGVRPETTLAEKAGLKLGARGISVDRTMRTSDKDIYAVGDAVEVDNPVTGCKWNVPLAWPAAKEAVVAANNICGIKEEYKGTQGTSIVKVFSLTAAMTGATEKTLKAEGVKYEKIYTHPASHAGYYPGASYMEMKVLFEPVTGKVLGAQVVGQDGVDKRVNVLSLAVRHGLTVKDMADEEFCYAPPYGSAKDAVNLMGMAALNHIRGITRNIHPEDLTGEEYIIDVRTPSEVRRGSIEGSENIPVDGLRERLDSIPKDKKIVVVCQVGIRGHIASRILSQKGYDVFNLSGGYMTYKNYKEAYLDREIHVEDVEKIDEKFCTAPTGKPAEHKDEGFSEIDVRGLQCPGPVIKLKEAIDKVSVGETVRVISNDMGFASDLPGWCQSTGNLLIKMDKEDKEVSALVMKQAKIDSQALHVRADTGKGTTIVVFSGDLDKVMAAFIIARTARASGKDVTMFFTFWGLNVLRKKRPPRVRKDLLSRMFGMMMPSSEAGLKLSKLNMLGIGTKMMKYVMKRKNVDSLEELMDGAMADGVTMVACSMSMDVMGIKKEELIDGIEIGGASAYIANSNKANHNLFI